MSYSIDAWSLKGGADVYQVSSQAVFLIRERIQYDTYVDYMTRLVEHLDSQAINDGKVPSRSLSSSFIYGRLLRDDSSSNSYLSMSSVTPKLVFTEVDGERLVGFFGVRQKYIDALVADPIFRDFLNVDLSYHNATDSQITDGLCTEEEFKARGKFWYAAPSDAFIGGLSQVLFDGSWPVSADLVKQIIKVGVLPSLDDRRLTAARNLYASDEMKAGGEEFSFSRMNDLLREARGMSIVDLSRYDDRVSVLEEIQ